MTMCSQTAFRGALLDADQGVPPGLTDGQGRPAGGRYSVYRNNVAVALRDALQAGFPAVAKLIGPENFATAAGMFLRQSQPDTPLMMHYGAGFPEFLGQLKPLAHIGYLADVARLEQALRASYHAADATAVDPAILQGLSEEALNAARFELAPSVRLLRAPWPVLSIYRFALQDGAEKPPARAEDVLILRPEFDPVSHILPAGGADFIEALAKGLPFADAIAPVPEDFDLGAILMLLLQGGAITNLTTP